LTQHFSYLKGSVDLSGWFLCVIVEYTKHHYCDPHKDKLWFLFTLCSAPHSAWCLIKQGMSS